MITRTQSYNFPGSSGATEVYYTIASSNSCVSVTPASGTIDPGDTVEFSFSFASEACFSTQFTLTCYDDACSLPITRTFTIANPCSTLTGTLSNTPSVSNPFIFTLSPSGGEGGYSISWDYNTTLFNLVAKGTTGNKLELSLKSSKVVIPASTQVKATITDANGCTEIVSYTYTFCVPTSANSFIAAQCITQQSIGGITAVSGASVNLTAGNCAGTTIDWSTLSLEYDTTKLHVATSDNQLTIYGAAVTSSTTYSITWSVANTAGIRSNDATVTVSLPVCTIALAGPTILKSSVKMLTGETTGATKTLDVESITFSTNA